jgi:hypothetical protein
MRPSPTSTAAALSPSAAISGAVTCGTTRGDQPAQTPRRGLCHWLYTHGEVGASLRGRWRERERGWRGGLSLLSSLSSRERERAGRTLPRVSPKGFSQEFFVSAYISAQTSRMGGSAGPEQRQRRRVRQPLGQNFGAQLLGHVFSRRGPRPSCCFHTPLSFFTSLRLCIVAPRRTQIIT